jgi:hypothetical protein
LHEKRSIQNSDHIPRDPANRRTTEAGQPHPRYRADAATALRCREGNRLHKQTNPRVGCGEDVGEKPAAVQSNSSIQGLEIRFSCPEEQPDFALHPTHRPPRHYKLYHRSDKNFVSSEKIIQDHLLQFPVVGPAKLGLARNLKTISRVDAWPIARWRSAVKNLSGYALDSTDHNPSCF